jgi:thiamine pyrophosphokinase
MGAPPCRAAGSARHAAAIVVTGGDPPYPTIRDRLPTDAIVIAADSGLDHAIALGLRVDRVIGDLDSVSPGALAAAERAGTRIERHPAAKDATDLELALDAARQVADRIVVVGGAAGRLDHLLGTALLLGSPAYADVEVLAHLGPATVHVVRGAAVLTGAAGEQLSLLPLHGPAHGVVTAGLKYPLHKETLYPGSTRGVSNEFSETTAEVRLASGVLLVVAPGPVDHIGSAPHAPLRTDEEDA